MWYDKLFELLKQLPPKRLFWVLLVLVVAALVVYFCSSCALLNRSSASGIRKVEKKVEKTQQWQIPSEDGDVPQVVSYSSISSTTKTLN